MYYSFLNMLMYFLICFILLYAIYFEALDYSNAYDISKPNKRDDVYKIIKKISSSSSYDTKTIKWRRLYISSVIATLLIFGIVRQCSPTPSELLLYIFIIYFIFTIQWYSYTQIISEQNVKYTQKHLDKLKKIL